MNEKKIAVIAQCDASGVSAIRPYLAAIDVPQGYEVELIEVFADGNVADTYQRIMGQSDAKYKVYLAAGSILLRLNFFEEMLRVFEDPMIGVMGLVGAKQLSTTGLLATSPFVKGRLLYADDTDFNGADIDGEMEEVMAVSGDLIATQYDIPWRSDLFHSDCFYAEAQCIEFRRKGYRTALPKQEEAWLLAASSGIYAFPAFGEQPKKLDNTPPVSVMGLNVWQQTGPNQWVVGSFSGIYGWDLSDGSVTDYDTGLPLDEMGGYGRRGGGGRPTFGNPVSGFSTDFAQGPVVFDYGRGARLADNPDMPFESMTEVFARDGRISFWHFCLELHVGRLYRSFLFAFTDFYIFLSGLSMFLVVLSGYIVYRRKHRRKPRRRRQS